MKEEIKKRIISLRTFMKRQGIAAFIIPSTDPHSGEYVPEHWESRKCSGTYSPEHLRDSPVLQEQPLLPVKRLDFGQTDVILSRQSSS